MIHDWLLIALGVVLTAGTFVFVAAEFSLVALDPAAVDRKRKDADPKTARKAAGVGVALRELSTELSGAQVGITLTTVLLGYTMQKAIVNLLGDTLALTALSVGVASALAVTVSLIIVNAFSMLFGELIPKNWAIAEPMRVAMAVAPVQRAFTTILRPLITVLNASANKILRAFGVEPKEELSGARSAPELASLVRHSANAGTLDVSTANRLTRTIGIGELSAVDVMTDRLRMKTVKRDDTVADLLALSAESGHSRFPVVGDSVDEIVGVASLRSAIGVPFKKRAGVPVPAVMVPAISVPETMMLTPLLLELREQGTQLAIVVDEYGGTSGIVTLEDVVEEIVGEVADEHDRRRAKARVTGEGTWTVPGTLRPDELTHYTGLSAPDDPAYETLGGLIMTKLGRLPEVGDEVHIPGVRLRVETMAGRRIESIAVQQEDEDE